MVAALAAAPAAATLPIADVVAAAVSVVSGDTATGGAHNPDLDESVRCAARRLAATGRVDIVVGGRAVDPSTAKGDVGLRRGRAWD